MSRNKFDFNACDWLSAKRGHPADAADGEDEFEAVDQRLSESQKFFLYKDLRDTVVFGTPRMSHQKTPKQAAKGKRLRETVTKTLDYE